MSDRGESSAMKSANLFVTGLTIAMAGFFGMASAQEPPPDKFTLDYWMAEPGVPDSHSGDVAEPAFHR